MNEYIIRNITLYILIGLFMQIGPEID